MPCIRSILARWTSLAVLAAPLLPPLGCAGCIGLQEDAADFLLAGEHGTVFYALDTLAYPDTFVELQARVISAKVLDDVRGAKVEFFRGNESLGSALTDGDGRARLYWKTPAPGDYELTAKIVGAPRDGLRDLLKASPVPLLLAVRPPTAPLAVIDLDHTIVAAGMRQVFKDTAPPMPQSAAVLREISRDYTIVYLSHRMNLMTSKSKGWLARHHFPRAVLMGASAKQFLAGSEKFKARRLAQLKRQFPVLEFGVGDQVSDVEAYTENGMQAYLIPYCDEQKPDDMLRKAGQIRQLPGDVQVVGGWDEIRRGLFRNERFPPAAFADRLEQRVQALKARNHSSPQAASRPVGPTTASHKGNRPP